jgi:ketosteroid isomerase-like protein
MWQIYNHGCRIATMSTLHLIERYLRAIENGDEAALGELLHPEVVQREHPNALNKNGVTYDRAGMLAAFARGKKVMSAQRYVVTNAVVQDARAAVELEWTGTLAIDIGERKAGTTMRAAFGSFFEVRDGRILRQSHYDCFLP